MKQRAKDLLNRAGVQVHRISEEERLLQVGYDPRRPPPSSDLAYLSPQNPRLLELEAAYRDDPDDVGAQSLWAQTARSTSEDLRYFRGDNLYLWQYTRSPMINRYRTFVYGRYVAGVDSRGLLSTLGEDGSYGCFTFDFEGMPTLSRDLLDSVNEMTFLGEHAGLFDRPDLEVLDIGAGYGRLAHRALEGAANIRRYWCVDAVPRSTFLCEYYLRHRGLEDRATVIPLTQKDASLERDQVDIAVNVHSFSEMPRKAVAGWVTLVASLNVPTLLVVPNERDQVLSREPDGSRVDCAPILAAAGYQLDVVEPTIKDAAVRQLLDINDHFLLYRRQ